jgi:hypothetical protein
MNKFLEEAFHREMSIPVRLATKGIPSSHRSLDGRGGNSVADGEDEPAVILSAVIELVLAESATS